MADIVNNLITNGKFSPPIDPHQVGQEWRARGFSCERFNDPPGREWRDFVHDCDELVTVIEGRLLFTVAGETCSVGPGDELLIPRGRRHSVKNVHDRTTHWLYGYN